jgi:hypothetical protein
MSFHDRKYEVFVILGNPATEPAWIEPKWKSISEILNPLVQQARGSAAVRSSQMRAGTGSPNQRGISFGRIGWNEKGHEKWIHSSSNNIGNEFISTEVWCPSWTSCEREGLAPDVYVAIRNEKSAPTQQVTFNPIFILAVALDADVQIVSKAQSSAEMISETLNYILRVRCARTWGVRFGNMGFTNAIGDLFVGGLFKPGPRNQKPPSIEMLEGSWEKF